jgi:fermentation-respiration switch protein FrsA (DUF1100 family)
MYITKDPYSFKEDSFSYSAFRGPTKYNLSLKETNETFDTYNVQFKSRPLLNYETLIYGLLFIPKKQEKVPVLILLPGGGVTKENEAELAKTITNWGYAVLTIDQRGIGQTDGYYPNYEDDYRIFAQGKEPIQHLSVYDALRSYDLLKKIKEIDKENIAIIGESMGARYAIIAAALDKRLKGVIAISTSGFHIKKDSLEQENNYFLSIDPDHYIDKISPRPIFMFHGTNDTMVKLDSAKITFNLAKEQKKLFIAEGCGHGYCKEMEKNLKNSLKELFG